MKCGRAEWQEAEATRKDFDIVPIHQEKFFTCDLFKVIQDAISLILHYRTMYYFWTISSSTFITSDVQSIYTPSLIQDWYREDKIWAKDRRYSFCLCIPWTKNTKILRQLTWKHRVLHNTCRQHGKKHQNTVYWVDIRLAQKKGFKFYQARSNAIILYNTLPAYCIPKAIIRESICVTPKTSFKDNWMKELGSEVAGSSKDPQRTQPKTKNPIVRTGRLVLSEQQSSSSAQEIQNVSNLAAKAPM